MSSPPDRAPPADGCPRPDPLTDLVGAARTLADEALRTDTRRLLGVTGPPGAGKSTLTALLERELGPRLCVTVPMDGFHLADVALDRLGRADRKGAPDTFDADGYVALLRRIRMSRTGDAPVWAPMFERELEQPLAGALEVPSQVPLVVTEGNYLLLSEGPFAHVRALLDAAWFVDLDDDARHRRLIERHVQFGKTPDAARDWALGPDEVNARLVRGTRDRADRVVSRTSQ